MQTSRIPVLDGLRAISILLVLACHMLPLGPHALELNATAGAMGMSLFFALSGFLITSTLLHNADVFEFLVRRMARILPLAYGYTLFVFGLIVWSPSDMAWNDIFLVNYVDQHLNSYNAHFWSLCVEVHFYLAIAFAVMVAGKRAIWLVCPACIAVTAIRIHSGAYIDIQTHLRVDEILAGASVAVLLRNGERTIPFSSTALVAFALLWFASSSPFTGWLQYLRPYATASLLAVAICQPRGRFYTLLASAPMRYIATVSYALYVIHPLTIHGWWNDGGVVTRYLIKRPISFAMTFTAAHFSTFYWERLWRQLGKRLIERRRKRVRSAAATPGSAPARTLT